MELFLRKVETLPRLAWCAQVSARDRWVEVRHGTGVETWDDGFCEGAWDGAFAEAGFDRAVTFAGTGARLRDGRVQFVTGTALGDRLHVLKRGGCLYVSNSLVFALVAAGDGPTSGYPYCEHHYFRQAREGLRSRHFRLPTRRGSVALYECANLRLGDDLRIERIEKPAPSPPRDFKEYVTLVDQAIGAVFRNATDPERRTQRYEPLATVSRGYDSPSLAVLARRHGCERAATFRGPGPRGGDDDGSAIATQLGYRVRVYRSDHLPPDRPLPEAEFAVCPHGTGRGWLAAEADLPGALVLSGAPGGYLLGTAAPAPPELRRRPRSGMGGTQTEFRLRLGFNVFKPWFTGWQCAEAIHAITRAPDVRPYWMGGDYDKPIARRLIEEAGIAREAFGQVKLAAISNAILHPRDLSRDARRDYRRFVRELGIPRWVEARSRLLASLERQLPWPLRRRLRRRVPPRWRRPARDGYLFHWGFHHVRSRYEVE